MSFISWQRRHRLRRVNHANRIVCSAAALAAITLTTTSASAAYLTVYGGPTYTPGVGGFKDGGGVRVNDAGTAVGSAYKYNSAGTQLDSRAFRWDSSGAAAIELGSLGTPPNGGRYSAVFDINNAGTAVGSADNYVGSGSRGSRAVRWHSAGTTATELGIIGTTVFGFSYSTAVAINDAGAAVGSAAKYNLSGADLGSRAVRWEASGTAATELGNLGTGNPFGVSGYTASDARAINEAGAAVGWAKTYDSSGVDLGVRPVRWSASGTSATELENPGTNTVNYSDGSAYAINNAGTAVGSVQKYNGSGVSQGYRAVRWDASGTTVTELGNLGTGNRFGVSEFANGAAEAINNAGTIVGYSDKFNSSGANLGARAVRWHSSSTAAIELGDLGADPIASEAIAVNNAGIAIGYIDTYAVGTYLRRPVYWGVDGIAVDLNTLIDPTSPDYS
jgi:hypothetical protein